MIGPRLTTADWTEYAAKAKLLKRLTEINKDILGVYMPTAVIWQYEDGDPLRQTGRPLLGSSGA